MKRCSNCGYGHNHAKNARCQRCTADLPRSAWPQIKRGMTRQSHPTDQEKEALGLINRTYGEGSYQTEYVAVNQDDVPPQGSYTPLP